jgi:hypothetical protein
VKRGSVCQSGLPLLLKWFLGPTATLDSTNPLRTSTTHSQFKSPQQGGRWRFDDAPILIQNGHISFQPSRVSLPQGAQEVILVVVSLITLFPLNVLMTLATTPGAPRSMDPSTVYPGPAVDFHSMVKLQDSGMYLTVPFRLVISLHNHCCADTTGYILQSVGHSINQI